MVADRARRLVEMARPSYGKDMVYRGSEAQVYQTVHCALQLELTDKKS